MNRITVTFLVLAAAGGCMAVDPDPINDYPYGLPPRSAVQGQVNPMMRPMGLNSSDGKAQSTASATKSWANPPQSTMAANTTSYPTAPAAVAKPAAPRPVAKSDKSDDAVVKASYTETKPVAAKTTTPAEPESPPVNLGMLRLLNSKRIIIRYEVKDPASTGVSDLEVWGTTDMRNWQKYDAIQRSPSSLAVNVKGEGLYGFAVLARAKGEPARNQPPQSEPPQLWVAVDMTKPMVQLLGTEVGAIEHDPAVLVRWNVTDRNLGPRPITLLYAERPEGPWAPIAANLENTGHYEWILPSHLPSHVCVRIQAADMMGNVGMAQSATLRIPERSALSTRRSEPILPEPPRMNKPVTLPYQPPAIRPIAAREPKPTTSILSADGD